MSEYLIYKICCDDNDYVYVGSTKSIIKRKSEHKANCVKEERKKHNFRVYQTIRENGGWDNWRMVVIEELGDVTKRQAEMKEEEWRQKLQANLNMKKAHTIKNEYMKEYNKENKEKIRQYYKEYNQKNKQANQEKVVCDCGSIISKHGLTHHKKTKKHQAWEWRQIALSS